MEREPRDQHAAGPGGEGGGKGRGKGKGDGPGQFGPPPPSAAPHASPYAPPPASPYASPDAPPPAPPSAPPHAPPPLPPLPAQPPDSTSERSRGPLRPLAVALLNLTGLGLGYLLLRRPILTALCCAATAALLLVALPADVDGVPGGLLVGHAALLALAAAHGALRAVRDRGHWPLRAPLAAGLGVVLLAVPAGGAFAYESARDEAVEQMLLDRLAKADRTVAGLDGQPFDGPTETKYAKALRVYRSLAEAHPGSKAAGRLSDSLGAYYRSVAAPYTARRYCDAVTPLTHLRTVPRTLGTPGKDHLGTLATWPDGRLATSLHACGTDALGRPAADAPLAELLRTFPASDQAAKVEPALRDAIGARTTALKGSDPCPAVEELRTLGATAASLPGDAVDATALRGATDRAVERGVYACGMDEFEDARFARAAATLNGFAKAYPAGEKRYRAKDVAIAAEIAAERPSAGRRLPPAGPAGGSKVDLVLANLGPGELEVLYTGPTTGRVTLKDCPSCRIFAAKSQGDKACRAGVTRYPRTTLRLPAGEYHFLYKRATVRNRADGARINPAYRYTDCSFVTRGSAGLGLT
ncbi:hypothetical protein [Streptomyces sp. NPDC017988]|uniref:hypothetical protein n=1 Tax=Streptomyces sp. NPDC017988 TaxID=3365025 RepID=UPI00379A5F1B